MSAATELQADLQHSLVNFRSKGPELLVDLADHAARAVLDIARLDQETADRIGYDIARRMMSHWAGQIVYFPKGAAFVVSERYRVIFSEFTGSNHAALARKYNLSIPQIYKIVKAVLEEERARRQGDFFPDQ